MTATVQATFGAGSSDAYAILELDDTLNLDADGNIRTTFGAADTVWFLLHCQPGYGPDQVYGSTGMVTDCGQVTRAKVLQGAVWTPEDTEVELVHYPLDAPTMTWEGNQIALAAVSGRTIAAADEPLQAIARADIGYNARFRLYRWDPPTGFELAEGDDFGVEIMITIKELP